MRYLLLSLSLILLVGCGQVDETPEPSLTATRTAVATETREPVASVTMALTATQTRTPYPTPTPFPIPTPYGYYGHSASPNGEWFAWQVQTGAHPYLQVESVVGGNRWEINIDNTDITWSDAGLRPLRWSNNGQFLYFATLPSCDGCTYNPIIRLLRLNLLSGQIIDVLPHLDSTFTFAISSDETMLAYIPHNNPPLRMLVSRIGMGDEIRIDIPSFTDYWAGGILWSPDNSRIVFSILDFDASNDLHYESFSIVLVDFSARTSQVVLENHIDFIEPFEWRGASELVLVDRNWDRFLLNIETGELTPTEE